MKLLTDMDGYLRLESEQGDIIKPVDFYISILDKTESKNFIYLFDKITDHKTMFTHIDIIAWNQSLQRFIRLVSLKPNNIDYVRDMDLNILFLTGEHVGYVKNIWISLIDKKVSISFDRYEVDIDNVNRDKRNWYCKAYN